MRRIAIAVIGASLWAVATLSRADILVGQTAGFSGQVAGSVNELSIGAKLYLDDVNRHGGVAGQQVRLIQLDDRFDPALAAKNAERLIVDQNVVVLFASRGTPHTQAILPLLARYDIALVAPSSGARLLSTPVDPHVFNVRTPYRHEAERAIELLGSMGVTRIAVVHVDDSFGQDALAGVNAGFASAHRAPVLVATLDRDHPDFAAVAPRIAAENVQSVFIIGTAQAVVQGAVAIRATGSTARIVTLSNNASRAFVDAMGANARGTIVSQVFPSERSLNAPVALEAFTLARANHVELTPSMMEGFVGAKVLVAALRRAGPAPTRARVLAALNGLGRFDVGGLALDFSPVNHSGLDYVDLSIINEAGNYAR